ncbi:diguanylate cyclase domain-containing protein [Spirulina sp. 06S082]|uniref:GGDEF domain-containing response regulator n=1 Tax=Spirulina sp. 06S082 TaxID=3110248 RepID=UPI002B203D9E|nr:diguanylate cyclase [Spirulina sp. 06S082]MEA5467428.1 diguanylate cyclase [Spirulina sp. 06S082]
MNPDFSASTQNILIVDNCLDDADRLAALLRQQGYRVRILQQGTQALAEVARSELDLILLDINLPDLNGYDLCKKLKANYNTQEVPVVFISSLDRVWDKVKAFSVGGRDYITKPFHDAEILARIENQLNIRNALKLLMMQNALLAEEICERQRIEKELRLSEEKFAKAFRSNPNSITITRLSDGSHIDVNETFCNVTEYSRDEVIGHTAKDLNLWVQTDLRIDLFKHLTMYGVIRNYEFQFRTKSGAIRTALLSAEIITIHGQECLLSLSNDITDRVRAEIALQNANEELKRLALLDGLTHVANRRYFNTEIASVWQNLMKIKGVLSLILCDVDYFKRYNDCYGHLAGDGCLQRVANAIAKVLKEREISSVEYTIARYGGEEFAAILPETEVEKALEIAEGIREAVEGLKIPHARSLEGDYVTLSLGVVTTIPSEEFSPEALIGVADLALYEAKEQGRNRVIVEKF